MSTEIKTEESTGGALTNALQGSEKQRLEETKTIVIKMTPGERPTVVFTGFWNGKILQAAMNSISRAYRTRRHQVVRDTKQLEAKKGGQGDERT